MAVFNEPTKWAQTLGKDADVTAIPDTAGDTDPSIDKIFPSVFSIPLAQGGRAIPRSVLNGLFKLVGDWSFYQQNGGLASYSEDFDYVVGRVVLRNDNIYKCIQANGASSTVKNPETNPAYWERLDGSNLIPNQIITSPVPLNDANLHLLDGALLSGSGAYAEYVTMMGALHDADPTANIWTDEATWQSSVSTYGECGKFVVDTVNNTVRLPKLSSFIQSTTTATELGDLVEAGAPDITGKIGASGGGGAQYIFNALSGAFSVSATDAGSTFSATNNPSTRYGFANFNASNSNPIYGNSSTIQPQAVKYYHYIVIGTVSKTQIQIDIDNVLTDLNGKADKDLLNVSNTANILMAHNAMPSSTKWDDLTLGVSGATYVAPADGYFTVSKRTNSNEYQFIVLRNNSSFLVSMVTGTANDSGLSTWLPVKKGETVTVGYTTGGATDRFRFIYAVGSESEQ